MKHKFIVGYKNGLIQIHHAILTDSMIKLAMIFYHSLRMSLLYHYKTKILVKISFLRHRKVKMAIGILMSNLTKSL